MKTKKLNRLKLKKLREIGNCEYGLKKEITKQHTFRTANIRFEDYEEHLMKTTALLEVCILALDGQGDFYTKMLSNKSRDESIRLVLEMVIELMPDGDNYKFQQMMTILEDDFDSIHYPENLKKSLKGVDHKKEKNCTKIE